MKQFIPFICCNNGCFTAFTLDVYAVHAIPQRFGVYICIAVFVIPIRSSSINTSCRYCSVSLLTVWIASQSSVVLPHSKSLAYLKQIIVLFTVSLYPAASFFSVASIIITSHSIIFVLYLNSSEIKLTSLKKIVTRICKIQKSLWDFAAIMQCGITKFSE